MTNKPSLRIAITGLDSRDNPYPGLALARSLKHRPWRPCTILALTYDSTCTGIYHENVIDEIRTMPYPADPEEDIFASLQRINAELPIDVLMPALDSEIATYSRLAPRLLELGIHTCLPDERAIKARNKSNLSALCRRHNLLSPRTEALSSIEQLDDCCRHIKLPFFIKGPVIDAYKANTFDEACYFYRQLFADWGFPVIVQEAIQGEEIDVTVLARRDHTIAGMVCMRKFGITSRGKAFAGQVIADPKLEALAHAIIAAFEWVGPCELELIQEASSGLYYVLEINARFPAWIYLSTVGSNLPWALVLSALNEPLPELRPPAPGTLFFRNVTTAVGTVDRFADVLVAGGRRS